ncbi:DUF1566 domain-containing protein [Sulfurimonas sp.]|nr:DUF1566 domain-containing protein [Sulfurimonas sp.]
MNKFLVLTCILFFSTLSSAYEIVIDSSLSEERVEHIDDMLGKSVVVLNGLMWQDNKDAKTITRDWQDAKKYCSNLTFGGYDDWYLPSLEELYSIVDKSRTHKIKKEFKNTTPNNYWSSSVLNNHAGYVFFSHGGVGYNDKSTVDYIRCVRAVQ